MLLQLCFVMVTVELTTVLYCIGIGVIGVLNTDSPFLPLFCISLARDWYNFYCWATFATHSLLHIFNSNYSISNVILDSTEHCNHQRRCRWLRTRCTQLILCISPIFIVMLILIWIPLPRLCFVFSERKFDYLWNLTFLVSNYLFWWARGGCFLFPISSYISICSCFETNQSVSVNFFITVWVCVFRFYSRRSTRC